MPDVHCFTSISLAYLDRARVLGETLRRFQPNWAFWVLLSDVAPGELVIDAAGEPFTGIVLIDDLEIPDLRSWIFKHDVVELCTAVKGHMLVHLLQKGVDKVVYLDPDIAIFSALTEVEEILDQASVVLTPHVVCPEADHVAIVDNEIGTLKHGTYNLGFVGVSNVPEGRRFAEWWRNRLHHFCYDDVANGLFTDQRWCDLVPGFFDDVVILRNCGYNVASWNLNQRPITFDESGAILAGGQPLRFFHFTKVNSVGEVMLARYSRGETGVFDLLRWYRSRLTANAVAGLPRKWWAFGRFDDGTVIRREQRLLYRERQDLRDAFPDPFAVGNPCFRYWYEAHVDTVVAA